MMKVKESEKAGLRLNIQKMKIMESSPITSWQIDGETTETVRDFIFSGSKVTANCDCSHDIRRHLLFGRKGLTNLESIFKNKTKQNKTKQKTETLLTKVRRVKAKVFLVVMYGCQSWTIKKAEHQRTDAFELWY